jgi:phage terminase large subunit-like protein
VGPRAEQKHYDELLELQKLERDNRLLFYEPTPKQRVFHAAGIEFPERLFQAGNRTGKTTCAAAEVAMHMTGIYPDWWAGRRFGKPVRVWIGSVSGESIRNAAQRLLLGEIGQHGTGMIPKAYLQGTKLARGVPDLIDSFVVGHIGGGFSHAMFKSYEQGREKWQGDAIDILWEDEEPPLNIHTEGVTRTLDSMGIVMLTETPLLGLSDVVRLFRDDKSGRRVVVQMTLDEATQYSEADRASIVSSYLPHELECRAKGVPFLGSGRVFDTTEASIACEPFTPPEWWPRLNALDFGWDHPTAAIKSCHDRDSDIIYIMDVWRKSNSIPSLTASKVKSWGKEVPVAWPHDGLQHDKGSGKQLAQIYREEGLEMISVHAQFADDRGFGLEAGVLEMIQRFHTGRLKVFRHLHEWFEEYREYHRKDGVIVKERDDLMAATRYGMMMIRYASSETQQPPKDDRYSKIKRRIHTWMAA